MLIFPFTAIVGQERMRRALVLNAIYPPIGGVLIRGERGTAKSTAARALAALLPEIEVVADCHFNCDPDQPATWCTECRERSETGEELPREECPFGHNIGLDFGDDTMDCINCEDDHPKIYAEWPVWQLSPLQRPV